ncbi:MAG: TonB-dependent receptor [Bacteroidales bacterium]|nr:TonB-dependent receptor [Bacteroidales bacterium]
MQLFLRRYLILYILLTASFSSVYSQNFELSGKVSDENSKPLPGALIVLMPGQKAVATDAMGLFSLKDLQKGDYTMKISFLGYKTESRQVTLHDNLHLGISMTPQRTTLQEVEIRDNSIETRKRENALHSEVVNDAFLRQNLGGSLMKSLERLPGVSTIDIGAGQSKPVIRGLGFNRVVVVENGVKHEGQQWGSDHGLEIDQFAVESIEVIKGPASLMYGSDAIGGIVDLKQSGIPANNTIGGSVDFIGKTNNDLIGSSVSVLTRKNSLYLSLRATVLDYADYKVPTDSVDIYSFRAPLFRNNLRNTAGNEQNIHASFGLVKSNYVSRFFISRISSINGFFANAHGLEPRRVDTALHDASSRDINYPYQEVKHFKAVNKSEWTKNGLRIESELGFQRNYRQEYSQYVDHGYMPPIFPDSMDFPSDLEREFEKHIYSANLKGSYTFNEKLLVTSGLSFEHQNNRIGGRGFMIPAYRQTAGGAFLYGKYTLSERSFLHLGLRTDVGMINTDAYNDWYPSPEETLNGTNDTFLLRAPDLTKSFSNLSWSVGYNYNFDNLFLKANLGKSFRMPIAKELAANGVNYHHFSYEVGNPDLNPEISYQLDISTEYSGNGIAVGFTPFVNYFTNYIYLNPGFEHDQLYGNGNQIFNYTESSVFRYGGEIHAHFDLGKTLKSGVIGEYVYSEQLSGDKKGFTLPFSPPASLLLNLKYVPKNFNFIEKPYFSIDYKLTAPQNKIVPPEEKTKGYQVINLSAGADIKIKKQLISVNIQLQNLMNQKYFNHMSYYRLINVPEPGRSLIVGISIPFEHDINE